MNAVALIDCNNFYVSCERLFQPHLNDKPVIVLSNNDGCVVSRSQEVKALGIPVGIPMFQVRDQVIEHGIEVYSSNYALYGDISSRVHEAIRHFSDKIENYSIDEAFVELEENPYLQSFFNAGVEIRTKVKRWTGIPTSVGIGPTKTLAKIAGNVAKKSPEGVFDLMSGDLQDQILEKTELLDIWGINTATARKLKAIGYGVGEGPPRHGHSFRTQALNGRRCPDDQELRGKAKPFARTHHPEEKIHLLFEVVFRRSKKLR
jgi:DNA polymerase V